MSVWKRFQRIGKKAAKYTFTLSFTKLKVDCVKLWQPDKLVVVLTRRNRRFSTSALSWSPDMENLHQCVVNWKSVEQIQITVTLFMDAKKSQTEDKEWMFLIEDVPLHGGRRKVIASRAINMKDFASRIPVETPVRVKLRPASKKVVQCELSFNLHCQFVREGEATDEDMVSIASLMSLGKSDVANLSDFADSNDTWSNRFDLGQSPQVASEFSELARRLELIDKDFGPQLDSSVNTSSANTDSLNSSSLNANDAAFEDTLLRSTPFVIQTSDTLPLSMVCSTLAGNSNSGGAKSSEDLLDWVRLVTKGYAGINVTNMTTSFRSGLAFCAILHHFHPDLLEYESLRAQDIGENNRLAFEVASNLGIPKLMEPSDMVLRPVPDWLSVMTYLHQLKTHFENAMPLNRLSASAGVEAHAMDCAEALLNISTANGTSTSIMSALSSPGCETPLKPAFESRHGQNSFPKSKTTPTFAESHVSTNKAPSNTSTFNTASTKIKGTHTTAPRFDELQARARRVVSEAKRDRERRRGQLMMSASDDGEEKMTNLPDLQSPAKLFYMRPDGTVGMKKSNGDVYSTTNCALQNISSDSSNENVDGSQVEHNSSATDCAVESGETDDLTNHSARLESSHSKTEDSIDGDDVVKVGSYGEPQQLYMYSLPAEAAAAIEEGETVEESVRMEMLELDKEQRQLDRRAALVERELRIVSESGSEDDLNRLMPVWFNIVNHKNALLRRGMQLQLLIEEAELSARYHRLQTQLQGMFVEEWLKTEEQKLQETQLLKELMEVVEKRDRIVQEIDCQERKIDEDIVIERDQLIQKNTSPPDRNPKQIGFASYNLVQGFGRNERNCCLQ